MTAVLAHNANLSSGYQNRTYCLYHHVSDYFPVFCNSRFLFRQTHAVMVLRLAGPFGRRLGRT